MVHVIRTGSRLTLHFAPGPSAGFDSQVEWSGNPRRSPFEGRKSLGVFPGDLSRNKWI